MNARPQPEIDAESRPYWEGAARSELRYQRCTACGRAVFYPRAVCPHCHADTLTWQVSRGLGTVYTYTVARRPAGPAFEGRVPLVIALVDLDEGYRMMSNVVGDPGAVRIGARVRVAFEPLGEGTALPVFELAN
jgi:uncharacterized OB-fold protein